MILEQVTSRLDPERLEVVVSIDFRTELCRELTFRNSCSRGQSASIALRIPRPDLDESMAYRLDGWYWSEDKASRTLHYALRPTDRDLLDLMWHLGSTEAGRRWLQSAQQWDEEDRAEWLHQQLMLGAELVEDGTRIDREHIQRGAKRMLMELRAWLLDEPVMS